MPSRKDKEESLLEAMNGEDNLNILYDCWTLLQRSPARAVEILMQFKDVSTSVRVAVADMQEAISRFDSLKPRIPELQAMAAILREWNSAISGTDEGRVLNRLNRIIETSQKIADLKKSGGIELIEKLLRP